MSHQLRATYRVLAQNVVQTRILIHTMVYGEGTVTLQHPLLPPALLAAFATRALPNTLITFLPGRHFIAIPRTPLIHQSETDDSQTTVAYLSSPQSQVLVTARIAQPKHSRSPAEAALTWLYSTTLSIYRKAQHPLIPTF